MMSKSADFSKKIEQLQAQVDKATKKALKQDSFPYVLVGSAVAVPALIGGSLYFLQPKLVQTKSGDKYVRSNKKVALWTAVATFIIWAGIYAYFYFSKKTK